MSTFKLDLHVHTAEVSSCARVPAGDIPGCYSRAGYQGLVITDHYTSEYFSQLGDLPWESKVDRYLAGFLLAKMAGEKIGLKIYLGIELRMDQDKNDYLVYGITREFLLKHPELCLLDIFKVKQLAERCGLLVFQAHPYRYGEDIVLPQAVHGIEVFNGNIAEPEKNLRALSFARQHGLLMSSGSDFHEAYSCGKGGLYLAQAPADEGELVRILRSGKPEKILGLPDNLF